MTKKTKHNWPRKPSTPLAPLVRHVFYVVVETRDKVTHNEIKEMFAEMIESKVGYELPTCEGEVYEVTFESVRIE